MVVLTRFVSFFTAGRMRRLPPSGFTEKVWRPFSAMTASFWDDSGFRAAAETRAEIWLCGQLDS